MAATFAVPAGRLADRVGQRRLAALGCAVFAAGCAWWLWRLGAQRAYAAEMLPGLLATGTGVGLTLAPLSSAAAASLPPSRFATGSAVLTMARQIGSVVGVAVLLAILGSRPGLAGFESGWRFMVAAALLAAGAGAAIGVVGPQRLATRTAKRWSLSRQSASANPASRSQASCASTPAQRS
jgi:MFS family permease